MRRKAGLQAEGRAWLEEAAGRLRMFAVTQITASFLLLAGACVLMKTLFELEQTRPPFDSANVLAVNLPVMSYGKTPRAGARVLSRGATHELQRCREWSMCRPDSARHGATIEG